MVPQVRVHVLKLDSRIRHINPPQDQSTVSTKWV